DLHVASTTTTALVIDKLAPTLGTFTIPTKTFGDTPFTLTAPSSASSGAFTYESVDTSSTVATVAPTGLVTITAAGTLQIRARQATTTNYSAASIVGTLTVNRATQQGVQASGLVAKWSFDSANTLGVNSAGTGDLVQTGGPTWTAAGKNGGALSLSGSSYLNLGQGATIAGLPLGNSTYTQTAWFNASALDGRGIIGWGTYGATNQVNALRLFGANGGFRHYWWGNDLDSGVTLQTGQWYHVAATFDGTTRKIYLNGQLLVSDQPTGHNATANAFAIGATNNFGERFMGLLDDVAIYNRALTATEIGQLASGVGASLTITTTSGNFGTPLTLATAGGEGTGAVTYQVVNAGVANCSIVGATLTSTSGGTCTIKATKAADRNYESSTSADTTVTINRIAQSGSIT
ncbi:MAG: LamG domain-containing protein, partial [Actinomycetota bacterium]